MITTTFNLHCDIKSRECLGFTSQTVADPEAMRKYAERRGWTRAYDQDICPGCRAKSQRKTTGKKGEKA